jgi:hypothetical protein
MDRFIRRVFLFLIIFIGFMVIGVLMPATPRASKSLLFAINKKDSLLKNIRNPRIIFVGGSNLSFGLNSQIIKDSLLINPVNTAVHASLGLKFMLENTVQYIQPGDIVVLAPEYEHYYRRYEYVSEELLRSVLDVDHSKSRIIGYRQFLNMMPLIPRYAFSKFRPREYLDLNESEFYSVNSFNHFGDTYTHWGYEKIDFQPLSIAGGVNKRVFKEIRKFEKEVIRRGGKMYITFPAFQESSLMNSMDQIQRVQEELNRYKFVVLGNPQRYMFHDSLMFNTPYHLNKTGLDQRTLLFIEDLQEQIISEWLIEQSMLFNPNETLLVSDNESE